MRPLVILPTYNEAENIENCISSLLSALPGIDLLVVDDESPDGTGEIVDSLAKQTKNITIIHRQGERGLGAAYVAGFTSALNAGIYTHIVQMDVDGSHQPKDLVSMIKASSENDLVIGSRYVHGGITEGWPFHRLLISQWGNAYVAFMLKLGVKDSTAGFRIYKTNFIAQLLREPVSTKGYAFQIEMTLKTVATKGTILEVPITFVERKKGKSKMSPKIAIESLIFVTLTALKGARRKPQS